MKILHLPTTTGGHAYGLSRGERALGLYSDMLSLSQNYFNYPVDIVLCKSDLKLFKLLSSVYGAFKYPNKYDILHFNFGSTLVDFPKYHISHLDLPLYKNQKLFVTYNGSDARLSFETMYPGKQKHPAYQGINDPLYADKKSEILKIKRIERLKKAGAIFIALNPDLMRCLPAGTHFLPYAISNFESIEAKTYKHPSGILKVVHAPTNRIIKGTYHVIKAVDSLNKKYPGKIELTLVEGMDNEAARKKYRDADVLIDQLRYYYGGLSVESMKMGVPTIANINEDDMQFLPTQMAKDCTEAFIQADVDSIETVLEQLMFESDLLRRKSEAGQEYVNRWHNPVDVARKMKDIYIGGYHAEKCKQNS